MYCKLKSVFMIKFVIFLSLITLNSATSHTPIHIDYHQTINLITPALTRQEAIDYCQTLSEDLIDLDNYILKAYFGTQALWVGGYYGDTYENSCIVSKGQSIVINPLGCEDYHPAICSANHINTTNNKTLRILLDSNETCENEYQLYVFDTSDTYAIEYPWYL